MQGFMDVVKAIAIRGKRETAQVSTKENVLKCLASLDIQQRKDSSAFATLLGFIEQESAVVRYAQGFHGAILSASRPSGVEQEAVFTECALTHINARLLLVGKPLAKETTAPCYLERVIGFDSEKLMDAPADRVASWNVVKIGACVLCLLLKPSSRLG
jgi:hypothetical protein